MRTLDTDAPHGFFDPGLAPAVTVDSGETVRFRTLESGWSPVPFEVADPGSRRRHPAWTEGAGHALTGPVEVRGARAGQLLEIRIDAVVPGGWGTTYANARPSVFNDHYRLDGTDGPVVHRWTLDPVAQTGRNQHGHTVALRPFLGVIGMPPAEPGRHSTIPPRRHGGNLDCRELVAGSTLWLPIPVDGALLSVGDGHAAQGGVSRPDAVALASVAVDLRVTQLVNQVVGAHAVLAPGAIR